MFHKFRLAVVIPQVPDMTLFTGFTTDPKELRLTAKAFSAKGLTWRLETHDLNHGLNTSLPAEALVADWAEKA